MIGGLVNSVAGYLQSGSFNEAEFTFVVLSRSSRVLQADGQVAVRKVVDCLKGLITNYDKSKACKLVVQELADTLQNPDLEAVARAILRYTTVVASLGTPFGDAELADCHAMLCRHLLAFDPATVLDVLRALAENEAIRRVTISGLILMTQSAEQDWSARQYQPRNHLANLDVLLVLELLMSSAFGRVRWKPPLLVMCKQWMDIARDTKFSEQQASTCDVVSNCSLILGVAAPCRAFLEQELVAFLLAFLDYLQHMVDQQHSQEPGWTKPLASDRAVLVTVYATSTLFLWLTSPAMVAVLTNEFSKSSTQKIYNQLAKLFITRAAFPETLRLVCDLAAQLNDVGKDSCW